MLLYFDDEAAFAAALAQAAAMAAQPIARHRFPDGELKLTLPAQLPEEVVVLRSLDRPNEKLIELLLAAQTARALGARELTLVAPYLGYMRQDIAFHPGEAVSQKIVGGFLAALFDAVMTVDPHLHRIDSLDEAVPARRVVAFSAAPLIGDFLAKRGNRPLLVGPDEESAQWVRVAAERHGFPWAVCRKRRNGDRDVEIALPQTNVAGQHIVLVDDVASTGHTLAQAARALRGAGAARIDAAVTHGIFVGNALDDLRAAGVSDIWSTDTVAHPTNAIAVAPMIATALRPPAGVR
jgi:ribose-phosphate pyrophosphokinase